MTKLASLVLTNSSQVFAQRDPGERLRAIGRMWSSSAKLVTIEGTFVGHKQIIDLISDLLHRRPECDFSVVGDVTEIDNAACVKWNFGTLGFLPGFVGTDIIIVEDYRINYVPRFS